MMYFGIPLRSKKASVDWGRVTTLFTHTLKSILNQTDPDFRVIVACHEIPGTNYNSDKRIEFIQVDCPYPRNLYEQMSDKGYKVHSIGKRIGEYGGGFTMIVDADDLISKHIVSFVKRHDENKFGWYIDKGYILYLDKERLNFAPHFPSGSNSIINYTMDQLPKDLKDAWRPSQPGNDFIITMGHSTKVKIEACNTMGRPLRPIGFEAAIYVLGTGENHSTISGFRSPIRSFLDLTITRRRFSNKIKDEFGIDWI